MFVLDPDLETVLDAKGATPAEKAMLVGFLVNQTQSVTGQIAGLRANAENATRQADELEPQRVALAAMLEKFTNEIPDPE